MAQIEKYPEIEKCDFQNLKNGKDYNLDNGDLIKNKALTLDPIKPLSYAFCSDTKYNETIIPLINKVDLLYHEATFLKDKKDLAKKTMHSTAEEAAIIAKKADVIQLILGHYSSRYKSYDEFLLEAQDIFKNTILAKEGKVIEIP